MWWDKTAVGLDIDDRSIEVAEIKRQKHKAKVISLGRMALDKGIVENGRIKQFGPLVSAIRESLAKAKPASISAKRLVFGLPINQTYTAVVELSTADVVDKDTALRAEAKRLIPIDDEDLLVVYRKLDSSKTGEKYFLLGASRTVVREWQDLARRLKLNINVLDLELYGIFRDLVVADRESPVAVVDIGSTTTNIMVFDHGTIQYSASLKLAGDDFSQTIADAYGIDFNLAEVKKLRLGLNRQLFPVLEPKLAEVAAEISRVLEFYRETSGKLPAEVLLLGGSSRLKGLPLYLADKVPVPVKLATTSMVTGDYPEYLGAIGFALGDLFVDHWPDEPRLNLTDLSDKKWLESAAVKPTKNLKAPAKPIIVNRPSDQVVSGGEDSDDRLRLRREKKLLLAIFLLAIPCLVAAFWYRDQQRQLKAKQQASPVSTEALLAQTFPFQLPISLNGEAGAIKGRIIEKSVQNATDYAAAEAESRKQASAELQKGELLWEQPMNEIINKNQSELNFRWLVFAEAEALTQAMAVVDQFNTGKLSYSLASWSKDKIEKTSDPKRVILHGQVTIAAAGLLVASSSEPVATVSEPVDEAVTSTVSSSPEITPTTTTVSTSGPDLSVGQQVKIGPTETGWLNVRSGPGKTYEILAKVNPGENYELLALQQDWAQIKYAATSTGWVAASYLQQP